MFASSLLFSYCRNLRFFNGFPALQHSTPEHCGAFKKLNYNIAYRVSIILGVTTIYMQRKSAGLDPTFQVFQATLPSTELGLRVT